MSRLVVNDLALASATFIAISEVFVGGREVAVETVIEAILAALQKRMVATEAVEVVGRLRGRCAIAATVVDRRVDRRQDGKIS